MLSHSGTLMYSIILSHSGTLMYSTNAEPFWHANYSTMGSHSGTLMYSIILSHNVWCDAEPFWYAESTV